MNVFADLWRRMTTEPKIERPPVVSDDEKIATFVRIQRQGESVVASIYDALDAVTGDKRRDH